MHLLAHAYELLIVIGWGVVWNFRMTRQEVLRMLKCIFILFNMSGSIMCGVYICVCFNIHHLDINPRILFSYNFRCFRVLVESKCMRIIHVFI